MTRTIRSLYLSGSLCASSNVSVDVTAHTLGGFYDTPHSIANAIMLPWVVEYNATACPERFVHIAAAMGEPVSRLSVTDAADKAIAAVKRFSKDVGIGTLRSLNNFSRDDIPELAQLAFKDMNHNGNPKPMTVKIMEEIYNNAY